MMTTVMTDTKTALKVRDLSIYYADFQAVRNVNMSIDRNKITALIGPSGCGKSTLLLMLGGMLSPTSGQVHFKDQSLYGLNADGRARLRKGNIGFVFQTFNLVPYLTALENVKIPLYLAGLQDAEQHEQATALLERVGLEDRVHHYPNQLSGGEQQRVAIARAFASNPKILFADEPTGNLDQKTGERIIDLLFSINRERGTTLVLVTHDASLARNCDKSLELEAGRLKLS